MRRPRLRGRAVGSAGWGTLPGLGWHVNEAARLVDSPSRRDVEAIGYTAHVPRSRHRARIGDMMIDQQVIGHRREGSVKAAVHCDVLELQLGRPVVLCHHDNRARFTRAVRRRRFGLLVARCVDDRPASSGRACERCARGGVTGDTKDARPSFPTGPGLEREGQTPARACNRAAGQRRMQRAELLTNNSAGPLAPV